MKDVKFRGKDRYSGEWLYGSLINNAFYEQDTKTPCCYILDTQKYDAYDDFREVGEILDESEVDPSTVAQYIDLKDVNDKEVYEGDIVEAYYTVDGIYETQEFEPGVIQWNKADCLYEIKFTDDTAPIYHYSSFKVLGNIYENPELLEEIANGDNCKHRIPRYL